MVQLFIDESLGAVCVCTTLQPQHMPYFCQLITIFVRSHNVRKLATIIGGFPDTKGRGSSSNRNPMLYAKGMHNFTAVVSMLIRKQD